MRLDGGTSYGGAVITPYYDSLLVKVTAWASDFRPRSLFQRMDRALREFRIRGVSTNLQFLENVINCIRLFKWQVTCTTRFIEHHAGTAGRLHCAPRPGDQGAAFHLANVDDATAIRK